MVVGIGEMAVVAIGGGLLSLVVLVALWPSMREPPRLAAIGLATVVGVVAWNVVLNLTNARELNVDGPIGLSFQDVGSGVLTFTAVALALGLCASRAESAARVVGAAAIAGVATMLVDLFT